MALITWWPYRDNIDMVVSDSPLAEAGRRTTMILNAENLSGTVIHTRDRNATKQAHAIAIGIVAEGITDHAEVEDRLQNVADYIDFPE